MSVPLTVPDPEFARLVRQTPEGMMFWSGTCNVPRATCGACEHYGYSIVVRNDAGNAVSTHKCPGSCALYQKYSSRQGKTVPKGTPACKYFEAKQP
jgi:hypothetical protein